MISLERFEEKCRWISEVTGSAIKKTTAFALWDELKHCDGRDFDEAVKDLAFSDEKLNLGNLWKRIIRFQTRRIEQETAERNKREDDAIRQWFRDNRGSRDVCVFEYRCGNCRRDYCDIVSRECMKMVKQILMGEMAGTEAHRQLAKKFVGIGFERHTGVEAF